MTRTAAIVCGAGVSSTFLARAVRHQSAHDGLDWHFEPLAEDQLGSRIAEFSVVFIGHHLAARYDEIAAALASSGVPTVLLDSDDHGGATAQAVTALHSLDRRTTVS